MKHATKFRDLTAATLVDLNSLPNRSQTPPRAVGGFDLIHKLADQADVEVWLAEKCSPHGIKKRAVVKRIARWAPDFERHRAALLDEARVTASFSHPSLATLVDAGEDANAAYIALEHVEGTTLLKLNQTLRARHRALPFELCCFIVAEALRGLSYAHSLGGTILQDRSPANILISSTGNIKLIELAPASAKTNIRSNIHSVALILLELLGEAVPAKLMELARTRYESAPEMLEALEQELMNLGRAATPTVLARTLYKYELVPRTAAKAEPVEDKKYVPQLRFVRGEEVKVTAAPSPGPPPLPKISLLPELQDDAEDTAQDEPMIEEEVSLSDVFIRPQILQVAVPVHRDVSHLVVIHREKTEAPLVLIVAALLAIVLFVAIVSYPA